MSGVGLSAHDGAPGSKTFPKIELHVHLEGTVRACTLLGIAKRNGVPLPVDSVEGLAGFYEYRDFAHFIDVWLLTTGALCTGRDFRQIVVDYAAEAASHGAVYLEGIFTPAEPAGRGCDWDEVFTGYCDGAQQAAEQHGVQVRLTPDYPPEPFARAFQIATDGGLGSVPHAGEAAGPALVRGALDSLRPDRIRHGIRAAEDPGLVRELAARGVVLDVCPISNLRTGVVASLAEHPLPELATAGIACSVSTDNPAMFATDLGADYAAAMKLGVTAQDCYLAGQRGALCDAQTKSELQQIGDAFDWAGIGA